MVACTQSHDHLKVMVGPGQSMTFGRPLFPFFLKKGPYNLIPGQNVFTFKKKGEKHIKKQNLKSYWLKLLDWL